MLIRLNNAAVTHSHAVVSLRCPACRQRGSFELVGDQTQVIQHTTVSRRTIVLGQRRCPSPDCRAHVFVVWEQAGRKPLVSYPPELIDFDPSKIPAGIVAKFTEALTCHAHEAYSAAAIMVRRTLEELCKDKEAKGGNLKARIQALGKTVVLPAELITGLDNLRLLGNDAAHVEAQDYDEIGRDEVELAIDVTKEVLKAMYQLGDLVERLESLKKPDAEPES